MPSEPVDTEWLGLSLNAKMPILHSLAAAIEALQDFSVP